VTDRAPNRTRALAGGFGLLLAVLGFLAVRVGIRTTALADDWLLVALPAFGLVGLASLFAFVSAFVPPE
jgi:hypothetical protein